MREDTKEISSEEEFEETLVRCCSRQGSHTGVQGSNQKSLKVKICTWLV